MSDRKVAFLGLGIMGAPMAANLARAGVEVVAWKVALVTPALSISSGLLFEVGLVITSEVTDGPRPPTGLMIAEVWVTVCDTFRVVQVRVTRTRL